MPRIETYTADVKPVVPDQPMQLFETGQLAAAGERIQAQTAQLGSNFAQIAGHIRAEQDLADYGIAQAKYLAAPKNIADAVAKDPEVIEDPSKFMSKFTQQLDDYQKQLIQETPNDRIHGALDLMYQRHRPEIDIRAQSQGLKLAADDNIAKLADMENTYAKLSAQAITAGQPDHARYYSNEYSKQVMAAVFNQHLTKVQGERAIQNFESKRAAEEMSIYANGNSESRDKMYELSRSGYFDKVDVNTHNIIMHRAQQADSNEQTRLVADANKREQDDKRNTLGLLATGDLPDWYIDAIKENKTNMNPEFGWELERKKAEGASGKRVRDPIVSQIATKWGGKERTLENINAEKAELTAHVDKNGSSDDARIRYDHLNLEYDKVRNTNYAQANQAVNKLIQGSHSAVAITSTPTGVQWIDHYNKAITDQITNEIQVEIRRPDSRIKTQEDLVNWAENRRKQLDPTYKGKDTRSETDKKFDKYGGNK